MHDATPAMDDQPTDDDGSTPDGPSPERPEPPGESPSEAGLPGAPAPADSRCGFVSLVGRTNVGKSTLINALTGQKVTITSPKVQTTQLPVRAILSEGDTQAVIVDTPGLHRPADAFGHELLRRADRAAAHCDLLIAVVEPGDKPTRGGTRHLCDRLLRWARPTLLVINKVDAVKRGDSRVRRTAEALSEALEPVALIPVSARTGLGVDLLRREILARMPPGPWHYPEDWVTDIPQTTYIEEVIREKVMRLTRDELPHDVAVEVEKLEENDDGTFYIRATIYCARPNQKKILVGKGGKMIREIGTRARRELEESTERPVILKTNVAIRPNWRRHHD